jgi:hypothetical protein
LITPDAIYAGFMDELSIVKDCETRQVSSGFIACMGAER